MWQETNWPTHTLHSTLATRCDGIATAVTVCIHTLSHWISILPLISQDTGLFGIYLVAPDNKLDDAMWYTLDNLVRLCYNVTDEEVARAKTQLKANLCVLIQYIHTYIFIRICILSFIHTY